MSGAVGRHAPEFSPADVWFRPDLAETWDGGEKHAARLQDAVNRAECRTHIGNVLQHLCQDDAIEAIRLDLRDDRRFGFPVCLWRTVLRVTRSPP